MQLKRLAAGLLLVSAAVIVLAADSMQQRWKPVEDAIGKGLPKTAIEKLEPIIKDALERKDWAEAIRAIGQKIALEGTIEGNKPEEKVTRLQAEIEKAPAEMKPVMEAILAHWYWHYFQQNRWRFQQRTQTAEEPGADFTTWDLPRILAEIDKHFAAALANDKALKSTPVTAFESLLDKGSMPDAYRPTMYDFLAHEALQFYQAGEQGAVQAEDEFVLDAESPVFGPASDFTLWRPQTTDTGSPLFKAVELFRSLLEFHKDAADKTAFADADLWRLNFAYNKADGETKDARYGAALKRFVGEWADHEVSARARAAWAALLQEQDELVEARGIAQRGYELFPKSAGGAMCFNIVQQIESKHASINTERVWNRPLPTIDITYRNVTNVYFRAVPYDYEDYVKQSRWGLGNIENDFPGRLPGMKAVKTWSASLPPTSDYRLRTEKLPAPGDLEPGHYFILASHDPGFREHDNEVKYAQVWVSDLALVVRSRHYEGAIDGFVLKADGGEPVAGAKIRSWRRDREGRYESGPDAVTDADGRFRLEGEDYGRTLVLLAQSGDDRLGTAGEYYMGRNRPQNTTENTVFFTDRSLYRPGQIISYKGICYRADRDGGSYSVLGGRGVRISFRDPNGKEVESASHKANEYGSFSGSFTAPRDRVTGRMTVVVVSGPSGSAWFNVEEYKRPKFQVELKPPAEAAKLGAEVMLAGKATAYTGSAIGGAKVKWRVTRQVQFPPWCWWWSWYWPPQRGQSQAIAHGSATTSSDGSFTIAFTARPDPSALEKDEPTFTFQVTADVTDTTGETRSDSQSVRAGFTALQADLSAGDWQTADKPVVITVRTRSLDGEGQAAQGTVKVYALKQPDKVERAALDGNRTYWTHRPHFLGGRSSEPPSDPADPNSWELGEAVSELEFRTDASGAAQIQAQLSTGIYRALLSTEDRFGKQVSGRINLTVVDVKAAEFPVKIPSIVAAPKWSVEPGETFVGLWGTGYESGRAFVELECNGRLISARWTGGGRTQELFEQPVTEEMRGGFTVRITYVRENRAYMQDRVVSVPWSNKRLSVKWERFTSKLEPGSRETWTAVVTGPDAAKAASEMVAALYDASLDQYQPHDWTREFGCFRAEYNRVSAQFENAVRPFSGLHGYWSVASMPVRLDYRRFPYDLTVNLWGYRYLVKGMSYRRSEGVAGMMGEEGRSLAFAAPKMAAPMSASADASDILGREDGKEANGQPAEPAGGEDKVGAGVAGPDLSKVAARKNLNETAFFLPQLVAGADGAVRMEFTMPEALTEWKFLGFAHDAQLRSGYLQDKVVTAKDLMVEPNPPRFLREGDVLEFTVKVSNQSAARQDGKVRLSFSDARTLEPRDAALGNVGNEKAFDVPAGESRSFSWKISVPDGCEFLTYKAVGATDRLSDGEEGYLPVLPRRILVTESLPLPVRGKQTKKFEFEKLLKSGKSGTLRHETLTVQMVSQPAWYAVMAMPYLMEYPYECSEQVFNRLYANSLARFIANSDPKIRRIFDLWKNTPALDSPMEKNQDLKMVMLEETPWYRQAMDESQARRNVGILFDANRLDEETGRTLRKLSEMQLGDGLWPWFPGCRGSEYITLYITTGFGRLRHLGAENVDMGPAKKSLAALDAWMDRHYRQILKHPRPEEYVPSSLDAFYLYGRSFFLKDRAIAPAHKDAVEFFLKQSRKFWLSVSCRQSQAHLAIALKRFGDLETPPAIMKSIKERSVSNEEMGMFWRDLELSWWWYRAPIETQAMMIEAFDEVVGDAQAVEDCRVWLLKQKQTQDWKTTKATADAIYGLLLRGSNMLASDALVEVALGGDWIKPGNVEAGTGFYEQRFVRGEIKPDMGKVTVKKTDDGVSWGSVHWQYMEDMAKVTPYEGTPLKLKKALYVKESTGKGQELVPVTGAVNVGDELVVRVELRVDRDMEYVHLKDQRGSGTEPVNVLSRYKYQDGLGYYESTKDTASHFFMDYLPKGVYVFEYSTRIQHRGVYQTGIASVQCMYAPEFNSHSASFTIEAR